MRCVASVRALGILQNHPSLIQYISFLGILSFWFIFLLVPFFN
tara:strand:- start:256 stop:384 length:129 start_codon:yes stop_codon:yes gene_type:complete